MSSRISISSSTTRISGATSDPFLFMCQLLLVLDGLTQRKLHADNGAGDLAGGFVERILERQLSSMVFENLADDREAKTRTLGARSHIGLGEAVPLLGRQADAVVSDRNRDATVLDLHFDGDAARRHLAR